MMFFASQKTYASHHVIQQVRNARHKDNRFILKRGFLTWQLCDKIKILKNIFFGDIKNKNNQISDFIFPIFEPRNIITVIHELPL